MAVALPQPARLPGAGRTPHRRPRRSSSRSSARCCCVFAVYLLALTGRPGSSVRHRHRRAAWQENPSTSVNMAANFAATRRAPASSSSSPCWRIQGMLLNLLPAASFRASRSSCRRRSSSLTVGALPLIGRQPAARCVVAAGLVPAPVGGDRRRRSAARGRGAILAITLPAASRNPRLSAQLPPLPPAAARIAAGAPAGARWTGAGSRLLERWIRDPREQAAFAFIWKTLARSRSHRLMLLAYAGVALGWITKGALDMPPAVAARRRPVRHDRRARAAGIVAADRRRLALSLLAAR